MTHLITLLSSAVAATIISALTSWFMININYKNEYYKILIQKRLEVYGLVEEFIMNFNSCTIDPNDAKPYHIIFSDKDECPLKMRFVFLMHQLGISSIWVSENVRNLICQLSKLVTADNISIESGKKNYLQIGEIRNKLVISIKNDLTNLHKSKLN